MKYTLRQFQSDDVERIRGAYRAGAKAVCYVAPCGAGKTVLFCYIAEHASTRDRRVLILAHRRELLLQPSRKLTAAGIPHGIIAPGFSQTGHRIQIGSVQTVVRRLDSSHPPDLIIHDECHHSVCETNARIIAAYPNAHHLGVTATPCRLDGRGLGKNHGGIFDELIIGPTVQQLIDLGYLSTCEVYAPPTDVDLSGLHTKMGDFDKAEVDAKMDKPVITGCALSHYRRLAENKSAIVFCASVKHAQHVAQEFMQAGYPAAAVDGSMSITDRDAAIAGLGNGSLRVITSCEIISEGLDVPSVEVGILLRPTKSIVLLTQQVGRCMRPAPGKYKAIILDHVGNCLRHGLPNEPREWTLEGGLQARKNSKDPDDIRIRQCPQCYCCHAISPTCPKCGHVYTAKERKLQQVDGELKQLTPEEIMRRKIYIVNRQQQGRCKGLEQLLALARQKGYSEAWAKHVWNARLKKMQKNG
jgi:DNA repair protein RadD